MKNSRKHSYEIGQRSAWLGIISNILLFAFKLFAGIVGRSQAVIADAFHTASDAVTSIAVLVGFKIAKKPADKHHPFGHGRAESIAAKIVSLILILVGIKLVFDSAHILVDKSFQTPGNIALLAAVISIIIKEITYRIVIKASKEINSSSLKADAYHHRSDALSSIAAVIGISGAKLGWTFMDPLAGIVVAGFIIKVGADVFHTAYDELMDAAPPEQLKREIEEIVLKTEGVKKVKRIMVRKSGIELFLEIIIGVDGEKKVKEGHDITNLVEKNIHHSMPYVRQVTVHVEPL